MLHPLYRGWCSKVAFRACGGCSKERWLAEISGRSKGHREVNPAGIGKESEMRLKDAIEILTRWQAGGDITSFDDVNIAVKLCIEALKRIEQSRKLYGVNREELLPGETLEGE